MITHNGLWCSNLFFKLANGLSACDVDKVRNRSLLEEIMLRCLGGWLFITVAQGNLFLGLLKWYRMFDSINPNQGLIKQRTHRPLKEIVSFLKNKTGTSVIHEIELKTFKTQSL